MENFVYKMNDVAEAMNVEFGRPTFIIARGNHIGDYVRAYRSERKRGHSGGFDMVLVKLPTIKERLCHFTTQLKGN